MLLSKTGGKSGTLIHTSLSHLRKVVEVSTDTGIPHLLTVISLRKCNSEMKKVMPLLVAKHYYEEHKREVATPPDHTIHLIIDEAHNILSQTSVREKESWKDYRLELFEEIINVNRRPKLSTNRRPILSTF